MKKKSHQTYQPRPTVGLILARARIRTGFRQKDRSFLKASQALYLKELATIYGQASECEQLELPLDAGPATRSEPPS
jgi:hypothetical protein